MTQQQDVNTLAAQASTHRLAREAAMSAAARLHGYVPGKREVSERDADFMHSVYYLGSFAAAVAAMTDLDVEKYPLRFVGEIGWRRRLADDSIRRLRELYGFDAFVTRFVASMPCGASEDSLREALLHVANVVTQVTRMIAADRNPFDLVEPPPPPPSYRSFVRTGRVKD